MPLSRWCATARTEQKTAPLPVYAGPSKIYTSDTNVQTNERNNRYKRGYCAITVNARCALCGACRAPVGRMLLRCSVVLRYLSSPVEKVFYKREMLHMGGCIFEIPHVGGCILILIIIKMGGAY